MTAFICGRRTNEPWLDNLSVGEKATGCYLAHCSGLAGRGGIREQWEMKLHELTEPLAITMWDFSWLERSWPGAGYEDWDHALDELSERGYNAVRIDAYPHLLALDPTATWTIKPCWNQQMWGSPAKNRVQIQPQLNTFIRKCADRGIWVGLSSWFQKVEEHGLKHIISPEKHAEIWKQTLDSIAQDDLMDAILYVDFCNEWPFEMWAPFFKPRREGFIRITNPEAMVWMKRSLEVIRQSYPDMAYTYSYVGTMRYEAAQLPDFTSSLDFIEPHVWMCHANQDEFYSRTKYSYQLFDSSGYESIVDDAQNIYKADPGYWKRLLEQHIDDVAAESRELDMPAITTECWGIVDYKDWPLLDWQWIKDLCAHGVRHAASTGRWAAMATSNFCGPQFVGMWRDVDWHQELTAVIKSASLPK